MGFIKFVLVAIILASNINSSKDRCGDTYGKCDSGECCS